MTFHELPVQLFVMGGMLLKSEHNQDTLILWFHGQFDDMGTWPYGLEGFEPQGLLASRVYGPQGLAGLKGFEASEGFWA